MLLILATVLWVFYDVAVSIVTAPLLTNQQWWAFVIGGAFLVLLTFAGAIADYRDSAALQKHVESLETQLATAQGNLAGRIDIVATLGAETFRRLQNITDTTGQSPPTVIEAANTKIDNLEKQLAYYEKNFWQLLTDGQKTDLIAQLKTLNKHRVQISANENPDCVGFARELRECFKVAGWEVLDKPLTGQLGVIGVTGFRAYSGDQKPVQDLFNVFASILTLPKKTYGEMQDLKISDDVDVWLIVGPKRLSD